MTATDEPRPGDPGAELPRRARSRCVVLIGLLTLTIVLFGIDAADGPLQVALLTSATFAGCVALKNGYTVGHAPRAPPSAASPRRWARSSSSSPSAR